jgi:hypothetical protein
VKHLKTFTGFSIAVMMLLPNLISMTYNFAKTFLYILANVFWGILAIPAKIVGSLPGHQSLLEK